MPRSLSRPGAPDNRAALRDCIQRRQSEEARLAALTEAQDRVHREIWHAQSSKVVEAEETLRLAARDEPQRKVYAYLNDDGPDSDPVADATAAVNSARAEVARLEGLEISMAAELSRAQSQLRALRAAQYAALAEIIVGSPEYAALIAQHTEAWQRLRTVKKALAKVVTGCHGQLPQRFIDEPRRSEPLEADRVGYRVDASFVGAWAAAMAQLEDNASSGGLRHRRRALGGRLPTLG
jgi:chromosome segregation ATPase